MIQMKPIDAYKHVCMILDITHKGKEMSETTVSALAEIKRLVDVTTPSVPIPDEEGGRFWSDCPRCGAQVMHDWEHCVECGQALKWRPNENT